MPNYDMFDALRDAITDKDELSICIAQDHIDEVIKAVFTYEELSYTQQCISKEDCHSYGITN